MKAIDHPNIIRCFYAWQERINPQEPDEVILYLLLEYVPETLYKHYRIWAKKRIPFPELLCKLYLFQVSSTLPTLASSVAESSYLVELHSFFALSHGFTRLASVIET